MTIVRQSVNRITDKHINTIYNGKKLIINEKNTPLQIRVGATGNKYYFHGMVNSKSITKMIGDCAEINLYRAYEILDEVKSNKASVKTKQAKTLLDVIYGDPTLFSIKNTQELLEKLPHGCFLFAKKDKSRFNNIRSDMNTLLSFYKGKYGTLSKLDTTDLIKSAEKLHFEQGRTSGGAIKTFNQWKSFFKWLKQRKLMDENLLIDTELDLTVPINLKKDKHFLPEEISVIFKNFPEEIQPPYGYLAPLSLLLCRRLSTISKIKKSYIDWDNSLINSNPEIEKIGKISKSIKKVHLEIMMSDHAKKLIKELWDLFPDSKWLFPNPNNTEKHIDVGPNGNTKQFLSKPREIFEREYNSFKGWDVDIYNNNEIRANTVWNKHSPIKDEIQPFSNNRLRATYSTYLHNITDNQAYINFICCWTSQQDTDSKYYNEKDYRLIKLNFLNNLANAYLGKIYLNNDIDVINKDYLSDADHQIFSSLDGHKSISDHQVTLMNLKRLHDPETQINFINNYRRKNGNNEEIKILKRNYYEDGWNFFNKVMDFQIYFKQSDLIEAKEMLTNELREFILSVAFALNNLDSSEDFGKDYLNYLEDFDQLYLKYIKREPYLMGNEYCYSKKNYQNLFEMSDVLFLQDLKDNFEKFDNVIVIDLNAEPNLADTMGKNIDDPIRLIEMKKLIRKTYSKINRKFKNRNLTDGDPFGDETRKKYREYLNENRKYAKLKPLWNWNIKLVIYKSDKDSSTTVVPNNDIKEHTNFRIIDDIIFSVS